METCNKILYHFSANKFGALVSITVFQKLLFYLCSQTSYLPQVGAQTSIKTVGFDIPSSKEDSILSQSIIQEAVDRVSHSWMSTKEPIGVWGDNNFTANGILEHLNVTKDLTDYLWYMTRYTELIQKVVVLVVQIAY